MGWIVGVAAALALVTASSEGLAQQGSSGIESFGRQVFATYANPDGNWPLNEESLDAVFTPRMAALIRRDRELAIEDLPYLDADPLCQCQDTEGLTVLSVQVFRRSGRPHMGISFTNGGERTETVMTMQEVPGRGWRIDDVVGPDGYSLAAELAQSNARIESGGRALGRD